MDSTSVQPYFSVQRNPLELPPVIKCILQYLNMEDLKNCRYISKLWSSTALVRLKARAKIVFRRDHDEDDVSSERTLALFNEDFSNSVSTPFTAFEFEGKWTLTELKSFLQSLKSVLHELYLNMDLYDDNDQILKSVDITPFISDSPMTRPNIKRNTKLSISPFVGTKIVLSISSISHVKKLELDECHLILEGKVKANPIELDLLNVRFVKNGDKVTDVCLNDIFDFSKSKKIQIGPCFNKLMQLDLSSKNVLTLDCLELSYGINLKNWGICKWSVKRLELDGVPFIERTQMQIKELEFSESRIDLSILPRSLETFIVVNVDEEKDFFSSENVYLPNLKYLDLNAKEHLSEMISNFVNCPLVELDLSGRQYLSREINFNAIPKSVKKLKLLDVKVNIQEGDNPLNLNKLVLENYTFPQQIDVVKVLISSHFKTKELVIVDHANRIPVDLQVLGFLLFHKESLDCNQRFYMGPFHWYQHQHSPLIRFVDKKSEYYMFENSMGKAVDCDEFTKLENVMRFYE